MFEMCYFKAQACISHFLPQSMSPRKSLVLSQNVHTNLPHNLLILMTTTVHVVEYPIFKYEADYDFKKSPYF